MSLIQEALEKAGRLPSAAKPAPVPVEEVKVEKIPAAKTDPFWLVGLKVKLLGILDKMRIAPARQGESRKTGLIAAGIVFFFLGAVFYVHTLAPRPSGAVNSSAPNEALFSSQGPIDSPVDFELTGITSSGDARLALINDQVVGIGETLKEGASVLEIQARKVVLTFHDKKIELEL